MYTILFIIASIIMLVCALFVGKSTGFCQRFFLYLFNVVQITVVLSSLNIGASIFDIATSLCLGTGMLLLLYILTATLLRIRYMKYVIIPIDEILTLTLMVPIILKYKMGLENFSSDHMFIVLQTNAREAVGFLSIALSWGAIIALIVVMVVVAWLSYHGKSFKFNKLTPVLVGAIVVISTLSYMKSSAMYALNSYIDLYNGRVSYLKRSADVDYSLFKLKEDSPDSLSVVLLLGESLCKDFMPAYGYEHPTTPGIDSLIASGDLLKYENAYSTHILTFYCVPRILTSESPYCDKIDYLLINLMKSKGYFTSFISSNPDNDIHESPILALSGNADFKSFNNNADAYDMDLVPKVTKQLAEPHKHKLVIAHMIGSHFPYSKRYPPEYRPYVRKTEPQIIGEYESSVRYTDAVVDSLMNEIRGQKNLVLVFLSDHGENPGKFRVRADFTLPMARIPMLVYFSPDLRDCAQYKALAGNVDKYWVNDFTFNLICSLAGIECPDILPEEYDLSSSKYSFPKSKLRIFGKPVESYE